FRGGYTAGMNLSRHVAVVTVVFLAVQAVSATTGHNAPPPSGAVPRPDLSRPLVRRPVYFEPNVGQFTQGVRYHAGIDGMSLSLTDAAGVLSLGGESATARQVR